MSTVPGGMTMHDYDLEAQQYLATLPLEHFMEAVPQSRQREITVESFAVLKLKRPDVQYYNELLVQYWHEGRLRKVVPDNMVAIGPPTAPDLSSYPIELMPSPPFLVLEYVSPRNARKDYVDNFQKYEQELKVPYYLLFEPDRQSLSVFRHDGERYVRLEPDTNGRVAIEELELEVGLKDRWVRFWHRGDLLRLPKELSEQIANKEEEVKAKEKEIKVRDKEIKVKDKEIKVKDKEIKATKTELAVKQQRLDDLALENLRLRVQLRATELGRHDILDMLAAADPQQLQQWLAELSQR